MRKVLIQTLKFLGFLLVGVILLWLAFRNVNFKELASGLKEANYSWVILSLLFGLFAYISRARRWMILIHPLGYNPTFRHTFYAMMTGYLANLALPRIGEITRCVALGKKEKIPADQLFGTVVVERTIDFFSILLIMVVLIFTSGDRINQFLKVTIIIPLREKVFSLFGFTWIIWVGLLLAGFVLMLLMIRYRKSLRKFKFFSRMFDVARGIINGLKTITTLKRKWEFIIHTVFIWICYTLMTWVVVFAIDSTSHPTFGDAVFLLVVGGLAMSAPVQGGMGAFHYAVSRGLAFVQGVSLEDGSVYAILAHESQLIFIAIVGAISFFIMSGRHKTSPNPEYTGPPSSLKGG
ncbi:MAG: flippase-like domain-containing protein [Bacteroidales bacterium]|nr:flippase-like domain-containing protein [Bacteroidales bacterium]